MTYEEILQHQPRSVDAGKTAVAAQFVVFLTSVIEGDRETYLQLADSQQAYLRRLRDKWKVRASGKDARWNEYGSQPGRPIAKTAKTRTSRRGDPGEKDPLFQSLMRKYGTPVDSESSD